MIDTWFKQDLDKIYKNHQIAVFIDESKEAGFLLNEIKNVTVYQPTDDLDELKTKYEIEKSSDSDERILIYTTRARNNLKFIREYCETNGCVEIEYLNHYIKNRLMHCCLVKGNVKLPEVL